MTHRLLFSTLLATGLLATSPLLQAITIGFETGEGYTPGHLAGQPTSGSAWSVQIAGRPNLLVTTGAGEGGIGNAVTAVKTTDPAGFYSLNFSNADLGGSFDPDASLVAYSFDFRYLNVGVGTSAGIAIIRVGNSVSGEVFSLSMFNNGTIAYSKGDRPHFGNGSGGTYVAGSDYLTIAGVIDYANGRFTMSVDGIQQNGTNALAPQWIEFQNTNTNSLGFHILSANVSTDANWQPYAIDNLSFEVIPEPSSMALLALSLVGGVWYRSRNRRSS